MPPRRKRAVSPASTKTRRSTRQSAKLDHVVPDVYQEMLAEVAADSANDLRLGSRPSKRRKVSPVQIQDVDALFESPPPPSPSHEQEASEPEPEPEPEPELQDLSTAQSPARPLQTVYDDFEDSDESDTEFEDVDLEPAAVPASEHEPVVQKSIQIDLSKPALETPKRQIQKRKPLTKAERMLRLDVHKWHLMSLMVHGLYRNSWCNDEQLHSLLKALVPRSIIKLFHFDESEPMFRRNHSFNKAVEEICTLWRQIWNVTIPGLRRSRWREDVDARDEADEGEDIDLDDFRHAAQIHRGSRDLGAQLFTALLRSIAVEVRLVFSLQVLPFTGAAKIDTPVKSDKKSNYIHAPAQNYGVSAVTPSAFAPPSRPKKHKKVVDSTFPIFWTEILTPTNTWIPLDPLVRKTISKPKTQFEPPLSDMLNSMNYVVAYEEDGSLRDVTRRYAQWFNAKTRKARVEGTKNGDEWYAAALSVFHKKLREPRDELEDAELAKRGNSEGMPQNVQDFKNHPVYVLERHMRANEVLQPRRQVGKMNVGTAKNGKIEPVFRRQDVYSCRTSDAWYRRGRDIKLGEQPLKRVIPKSRKGRLPQDPEFSDEDEGDEADGVGLYAEYQTNIYEPPEVDGGRVPRNAYGNLDVYAPSMIPAGGVHISHTLAAPAARLLGIDFADAVVGFDFKGRQGTAVTNGVVVAEQYTAAVATVINGLETLGSEQAQQARTKIVLDVWKRMLQALRVRERVEMEYGRSSREDKPLRQDGEDDPDADADDPAYEDEDSATDEDVGGGFVPEDEPTEEKVQEQTVQLQVMKAKMPALLPDEVVSVPIKITRSPHKLSQPSNHHNRDPITNDNDDLFNDEDGDPTSTAGGFLPTSSNANLDPSPPEGGGGGGGFIAEDDADFGGGFVPEDDDDGTDISVAKPTAIATTAPVTVPVSDESDTALQQAIAASLSVPHATNPVLTSATTPRHETPEPRADRAQDSDGSNDSDNESRGSLMSHDPHEDDEEPEWLNDALDE